MIAAWMGYTIVIGACAVAVAAAAEPLLRSYRMATRWGWLVALVAAVVVPAAMAVRPVRLSETPAAPFAVGAEGTLPTVSGDGWLPDAERLDAALLAGWGAASMVLLVIVGTGVAQLGRVRRRSPRATLDGEPVVVTGDIGPGATWFGAPRIVVPLWACALGEAERSLLVRHEREHVRAGDPLLHAASLLALVAAPWNVPLWYLVRRLRSAIEMDCDARVLAVGGDVQRYGELLLTVAGERSRPRLATLLTFAEPSSPLERRIRVMTERRPSLSASRKLACGALIVVAVAAACEARRPEPLAPVSTYRIEDGQVTVAAEPSREERDSTRSALATEMRLRVPDTTQSGDPNDPVAMVYSATGELLWSGRLTGGRGAGAASSIPVAREAIDAVEVIKRGDLLPAQARGGLVRITLKPGAERAEGTWTGGAPRVAGDSGSSTLLREQRRAPSDTSSRSARPASPGGAATAPRPRRALPDDIEVVVYDAEGKVFLRERGGGALQRLTPETIERVDVEKRPDPVTGERSSGTIHVRLKRGATMPR